MSLRENMMKQIDVDAEKSELRVAGQLFAYHCDKFNTRILKGLEDTLGFEKARDLLENSAESTMYDTLTGMFDLFEGSTPEEKLNSIFEAYKVLGHGNISVKEISASGGTATAKPSYMVEGWLENEERWGWGKRENPICHDEAGAIAAAFEIAFGLSKGSAKVTETQCYVTGADSCEFKIEVA